MTDSHQSGRASQLEADAYGQASLILIESLIHELLAQSVLTTAQAMTVLEVASDTQQAIADDMPHSGPARAAAGLLHALTVSFQVNLVAD